MPGPKEMRGGFSSIVKAVAAGADQAHNPFAQQALDAAKTQTVDDQRPRI
jgi:hypothetical protein